MATPNTSISSLGLSDVNDELNFPNDTARAFNDGIFRNLTGRPDRVVPNTAINISDLSDKTAFGGIVSPNSNNVTSYGVIEREIALTATTDMYSPTIHWSANVVSGAEGRLLPNGKTARYVVVGRQEENVSSNVQITATLSYEGHVVGTASKYISFQINSLPSVLFVAGETTKEVLDFKPTTVSTTLAATANAPGASIVFTVTPNDAGVLISGNNVTLSAQALGAGQDNVRSYAVKTELFFEGQLLETINKQVDLRAYYVVPDFNYVIPATTNNVFANSGNVVSSITVSANHIIPEANLEWSAVKVSDSDATLTVSPDRSSANLHFNVPAGTFEAKKAVYDVTARLVYANGQSIASKTTRLTLRAGAYGLDFHSAPGFSASGYNAQTAITTASASFRAGQFSWDTARRSGSVATLSETITANSATLTMRLSRESVGTSNSTYRINPVLTFDGVVMANVTSETTISAQHKAFDFSLSGPTSNTVVGDNASATVVTAATHNIPGGSVVWNKSSSAVSISSNNSAATTTYATNSIGTASFTLTATLRDELDRTVDTLTRSITLRAYDPNIGWSGANNVNSIGYTNQSATATIRASARSGANTFALTARKLEGATLSVNTSGNTTSRTATLTATRDSVGTTEGLYELTATATWFGVSQSKKRNVLVAATKEAANFTLSGSGESKSSFNFPVVANGEFSVSHSVPGGTISWSRSVHSGSVSATPVANNTHYVFNTRANSVGTASADATVTATLRDSSGGLVGSQSKRVTASATVRNPSLSLDGPTSNTVSNTFSSEASIVLRPSVTSALSGHSYTFSWKAVSGSATVTSNSTAVVLRNSYDGAGSKSGTYDVTCNLVVNGQTIDSVTKRVTVTASCPAPTYNFSASNDTTRSFNFPVNAQGQVNASTSPGGAAISWSWSKVSGSNLSISTQNNGNRLVLGLSTSSIGSASGVYDVTATYRTPGGTLLTTKTTRVTVTAQRYNPALTWNYTTPSTVEVSGYDNTLTSRVSLKAGANSSLSGHAFRITASRVSGNKTASLSTSNTNGTASVTLTNNRSNDGTNEKTASYDVFVDVVLNGQVIAGKSSRRTHHKITPGVVQTVGAISSIAHVWSGTATAGFHFASNGVVSIYGTVNQTRQWMNPGDSSVASQYEISFDNGASWRNLGNGATKTLSVSEPRPGQAANRIENGTYTIRRVGGAVVGSSTYELQASVGQLV